MISRTTDSGPDDVLGILSLPFLVVPDNIPIPSLKFYPLLVREGLKRGTITIFPEAPHYIPSPVDTAFDYLNYSLTFADSIIAADNYAKGVSGGSYTQAYYDALWSKTRNFTQELWQRSAVTVASFWYTAWVNAHPSLLQAIQVNSRWNMISVPVYPENFRKDTLFPTAISPAYGYKVGYELMDTVIPGKGYWLKFASAQPISMSGHELTALQIPVSQGWNMIGSISVPIPTSNITSDPPGLVTSDLYAFNHDGYSIYDTVWPGKGYWVRVNQAGSLILSSMPDASMSANRIKIVRTMDDPPSPPAGVTSSGNRLPVHFALEQNYPNPFNPATRISYQLPVASTVVLKVYNVLGQVVATLVDGREEKGYRSTEWRPNGLASGIYLCRFEAVSLENPSAAFVQMRKMLLMK